MWNAWKIAVVWVGGLRMVGCGDGTGSGPTICEEVADEAEASGCAVGGDAQQECVDDVQKRAQCLHDNAANVCSITDAEAEQIIACLDN